MVYTIYNLSLGINGFIYNETGTVCSTVPVGGIAEAGGRRQEAGGRRQEAEADKEM